MVLLPGIVFHCLASHHIALRCSVFACAQVVSCLCFGELCKFRSATLWSDALGPPMPNSAHLGINVRGL